MSKLLTLVMIGLMVGSLAIQCVSAAVQDQHNQLQNVDLEWHNGAINQINSAYSEGDVVPYRYELTGLPGDADIYLKINYQFTKGGIYAFDFLASFDLTESSTIAASGGLFGDSTPLSTLTLTDIDFTALQIPDDPSISTDNLLVNSYGPQYFAIGGNITSQEIYSGPTLTGDITDDSEKSITLKIRTTSGDDLQLLVTWGGHLAIGDGEDNWPIGFGASSIMGAPYHQSISGFVDANNNGQNDPTEKAIGPGDRAIQTVDPFVIDEIPLGAIFGLIGMFAAFGTFYFRRKNSS